MFPATPNEPPPSPAPVERVVGHLHPLTLVLAVIHTVRNLLLPAIGLLLLGRHQASAAVLLVFVFISISRAVTRYFSFSYCVADGELVTRDGILERTERHIPLERVQDIRIEQGLLQRLFGVVDVHVETAGRKGPEASLSVLSKAEAERLRRAVFERAPRPGTTTRTAQSAADDRHVIRQLSLRELILAGLSSNRMASGLVLALTAWAFLEEILGPRIYRHVVQWITALVRLLQKLGGRTALIAIGLAIVGLIFLSVLVSVVGAVVLFYRFTLSRQGEDLHRSYGLLTRRASSLPRRRIQVLEVEEGMFRRLFRLVTLRADTAGGAATEKGERHGGRDVLLPVLPRAELHGLLPTFFPDLEADLPPWRHVSRLLIRRGTVRGLWLVALLAALTGFNYQTWFAAVPVLLLGPVVYLVNVLRYHNFGYRITERYLFTRRGWLGRSTHIVPIRNLQSVAVRQTPFDRRLGLGTLVVDTAGQAYTGGGPRISNLPLAEARALAQLLSSRAALTRYRW
jgi:putative membrane protein